MNKSTDEAGICIGPLAASDAPAWQRMREQLGPEWFIERFDEVVKGYLRDGTIDHLPHAVLVARPVQRDARGTFDPVGFAEVSLRPFAEGCQSTPVGYLEGWFVVASLRGRGIGRMLLEAAERWAHDKGCREFASDAELHNAQSLAAHRRVGFDAVCDIRCFRKPLA